MKIKAFYLSGRRSDRDGSRVLRQRRTQIRRRNGPRQTLPERSGRNGQIGLVRHSRRRQRLHGHAPHLETAGQGPETHRIRGREGPRRVQQTEQHLLHTASQHQLRIRKQRGDPRRQGRLQSGDNHPASAHHGAEQDGIRPCAAHRRKGRRGSHARCSKAPTHSSWPQRRFPIRT